MSSGLNLDEERRSVGSTLFVRLSADYESHYVHVHKKLFLLVISFELSGFMSNFNMKHFGFHTCIYTYYSYLMNSTIQKILIS